MTPPLLIGIGGAHSGAGKTTYAELLLGRLRGWGAVKYTKTALYSSLVEDLDTLMTEDKDTRRMLDAGAERVIWVKSPPSELGELLPQAVDKLSDLPGVVIEGNSAIEFLKPDIIIFIFGKDAEEIKESAVGTLRKADAVVGHTEAAPAGARVFRKDSEGTERFLSWISLMVEKKEEIRKVLREQAASGRLSCASARGLASRLGVAPAEVGRAADALGIKIADCELGCF